MIDSTPRAPGRQRHPPLTASRSRPYDKVRTRPASVRCSVRNRPGPTAAWDQSPRRFTTGEPGTGTPTDREGEGTMKALTWHGRRDVRVETVPDPTIEQDTDAIVRVTSSGICGSDLHLYEVLGAFLEEGDILGHEPMGIVEAVGSGVSHIQPRGRGVGPVNNSRGHCFICNQGPFSPGEA